ncbi:ABC-type transport auxiliary lipoprotein family protein [Brevundimonas sp. M20]|uniref:ABC-type transport auxiliary lipoprotein family protein n=1 Tax=Brevundimonas sp. M20 TaxID=2591463 RepID=UPI001F0F70CA|nr:ABC-type transport auxiliary lipoprotein family protein [Brevundimonas sp. M20]
MTRILKVAAAVAAVALLGGCSLLSTPEPVQLYRFGNLPMGQNERSVAGVQVVMRRAEFAQAVRGDRILGVTGTEAAYIKGARWVSSADVLFSDALESAFAAQAERVRLVGPRELTRSGQALDIDVRTFEARYASPGAAPVATIITRVRLLNAEDRSVTAEQVFLVEKPAAENRVGAIISAFDEASRDLNTQIVEWTDRNARNVPAG